MAAAAFFPILATRDLRGLLRFYLGRDPDLSDGGVAALDVEPEAEARARSVDPDGNLVIIGQGV